MITVDALRNPARESGFNYVGRAGGAKKKPWRAQRNAGAKYGSALTFRGRPRATSTEAAQDFCDYINSGVASATPATLRNAGHVYSVPSRSVPSDIEAARGMIRDYEAQRRGDAQGYVYLIVEIDEGSGALGEAGKIGYSVNPEKRVAELQTGNPRLLRLLAKIPGTLQDEDAMHAKYVSDNVLAEWFKITPSLLREFQR